MGIPVFHIAPESGYQITVFFASSSFSPPGRTDDGYTERASSFVCKWDYPLEEQLADPVVVVPAVSDSSAPTSLSRVSKALSNSRKTWKKEAAFSSFLQ